MHLSEDTPESVKNANYLWCYHAAFNHFSATAVISIHFRRSVSLDTQSVAHYAQLKFILHLPFWTCKFGLANTMSLPDTSHLDIPKIVLCCTSCCTRRAGVCCWLYI